MINFLSLIIYHLSFITMLQQSIALLIIIIFVVRLFVLKKKDKVSANEFIFWLIFWLIAASGIIFVKHLDRLAAALGFSASGIQIILYVAVAALFYMNFRLRLKVEKMNKDITSVVRKIAIDESEKNKR
jgi:small membrane protein